MTVLGSLLGLLHLICGLGWLEKTSLYLQDKVWAIRITSMGLGYLPSMKPNSPQCGKMFCIYSKKPSSFQLWEIIKLLNHCCTDVSIILEVWTARGEPCQQARAKWQSKNRWVVDSSSQLHIGHSPLPVIPLFFNSCRVGRLSCNSFQTKVQILCGFFILQISLQTLLSTWFTLRQTAEDAK